MERKCGATIERKGNTGKCLYLFTSSSCFLPWDRQQPLHLTCFWHIPVSHMSTTPVPCTSHPWAWTKLTCFCWQHWKTEQDLSDWDEQFLLSWTDIFAYCWRRGRQTLVEEEEELIVYNTLWTGGRRNTAHKAHRKPEAHSCYLMQHVRQLP